MNKIDINSPKKVIYCNKCVHSNQLVTSSPTYSDDKSHTNRTRISFIHF